MVNIILIISLPVLLFSHSSGDISNGFLGGITHPLFGLDHLVAMIAVGLWGAILKRPAIWALPLTFPIVMAIGGAIGTTGIEIPFVEISIALSAIVLGLMVALAIKANLFITAIVVGFFAIFHGYAHGVELPQSANAIAYGAGFVIATGLLHLTGILIGLSDRLKNGYIIIRGCGILIILVGSYFLYKSLV